MLTDMIIGEIKELNRELLNEDESRTNQMIRQRLETIIKMHNKYNS